MEPNGLPHDDTGGPLDRRGFLRRTAGGTVAIAAAACLPTGCASEYPQARTDGVQLRALSEKEYATARAAAAALLVGVPVPAATIARAIDRELALIGDPIRTDMKTVLGLLEHLTLLNGHTTRFSALDDDARLAYLNGWRDSRFTLRRAAFQAVKQFTYFYAYAEDSTRAVTGFTGPWREHIHVAAYPVDFGTIA